MQRCDGIMNSLIELGPSRFGMLSLKDILRGFSLRLPRRSATRLRRKRCAWRRRTRQGQHRKNSQGLLSTARKPANKPKLPNRLERLKKCALPPNSRRKPKKQKSRTRNVRNRQRLQKLRKRKRRVRKRPKRQEFLKARPQLK